MHTNERAMSPLRRRSGAPKLSGLVHSVEPTYGGPPVVASAVCEALVEAGWECRVLSADDAAAISRARRHQMFGDPRIAWGGVAPLAGNRFGISASIVAAIERAIASADVIHVHQLWDAVAVLGALAALRRGKPLVLTVHGLLHPWRVGAKPVRKKLFLHLFVRRILREATYVHCLTEDERAFVLATEPSANTVVVPNCVAARAVSPNEARRGHRAVFIGRLSPEKGIGELAQAWAEQRPRNWELVVAGSGPASMESALREAAARCETIRFEGFVGPGRRDELLASSSLFVFASRGEGASIAALEALAAGVPVVGTEALAMPEIERGGAGRMFPTTEALCRELSRTLASLDERTLRAWSAAARGVHETHFSPVVVADRYRRLFTAALEARPA